MILKGSQRGNAAKLARHLMNVQDYEHVELHELRGFVSDELLLDALLEAQAVSKGTRCQQHLFSLSLNPPEGERVDVATFEAAIELAEQRLGLDGQPRAIVFHEKEGRQAQKTSDDRDRPARDHVNQNFQADRPNRLCVADILISGICFGATTNNCGPVQHRVPTCVHRRRPYPQSALSCRRQGLSQRPLEGNFSSVLSFPCFAKGMYQSPFRCQAPPPRSNR